MSILEQDGGAVNGVSETEARSVAARLGLFVASVAACKNGALIPLARTAHHISPRAGASIAEGAAFDAGFVAGASGVEVWDCAHAAADLSAAWLRGHASGLEAQAAADAPAKAAKAVEASTARRDAIIAARRALEAENAAKLSSVSALDMTLDEFAATLPDSISSGDHAHLFGIARVNAQTARNLETRADELAALLACIEAQNFTVMDLVAFGLYRRGDPAFGFMAPDYVLPAGYRRADWEEKNGEVEA